MRLSRFPAPLLLVFAAAACLTARPRPDAIARLEAERTRTPGAAPVHRALGIALYKADRLPEARASLDRAAALDPRDGTTALYLGLVAEQQGDLGAARDAYAGYLRYGKTRRVRRQLESRLAALQRAEIEASAKAAVANEAAIGQVTGNPRVVGVLPFRFAGADSSLQAIGRGLAELVTTDLARSRQITVVERARLQAVLDELALQRSGRVDSTTQVRAGRLLRAGRLVQGSVLQVGAENLRVDAAVVDVPTTRAIGTASEDDRLSALLDLEKRLVLALFDDLGVTLTAAERREVDQRPTRSLAAFLAYSRGLEAEDDGRFEQARGFYRDAVRIDPGFGAAAQRGDAAANVVVGQSVTTAQVEAAVVGTAEGQVAAAATQGATAAGGIEPGTTAATIVNDVNPTQAGGAVATTTTTATGATIVNTPTRDPAAEATGNDSPTTRAAKIVITIPVPTGSRGARP